jgi:ParB family transcriptional regulator, chromosome partitioning protein
VLEGLSVRQTESLLKAAPVQKGKVKPKSYGKDADTRALEADISATLGMPIDLDYAGGGRGKVTITFSSMEQLDRLCSILGTPSRG